MQKESDDEHRDGDEMGRAGAQGVDVGPGVLEERQRRDARKVQPTIWATVKQAREKLG